MMRTLRHALLAIALVISVAIAGCGGGAGGPAGSTSAATTATGAATTATGPAATATGPATTGTGGETTASPPTTPATGTTPAGAAGGVIYGIGDAPGWFARCTPVDPDCCSTTPASCRLSQTEGYFDARRFLALTTPASAHQVRQVRLFVEYDAVQSWNGSTTDPGCVYSHVFTSAWQDVYGLQPAAESWHQLLAGVIEARADGLEPVVAIAGYPFSFARPSGDAPTPDPTTIGGYWTYRCGVEGILSALSRLPAWQQPHVWEPMNEPDGFSIFKATAAPQATGCAPTADGQPDGAAKAACDEVVASRAIHGFAGHADDTVLAGTFEHLDPDYLALYAGQIAREMPGAAFPDGWSAHDYRDVDQSWDATRANALATFDVALARDTGGRARSLWITEAGTVLTSHVRAGDCPAAGIDAAGTLGACLNGSPARQAAAAAAFFALPGVANAVPITHLFWYQFESAPDWDSGLLDTSGQPRAAYCVFYGQGTCNGDPDAPTSASG
jgi:hypothetical protein